MPDILQNIETGKQRLDAAVKSLEQAQTRSEKARAYLQLQRSAFWELVGPPPEPPLTSLIRMRIKRNKHWNFMDLSAGVMWGFVLTFVGGLMFSAMAPALMWFLLMAPLTMIAAFLYFRGQRRTTRVAE